MVKDTYQDRPLTRNIGHWINSDGEMDGHDAIALNYNAGPTNKDFFGSQLIKYQFILTNFKSQKRFVSILTLNFESGIYLYYFLNFYNIRFLTILIKLLNYYKRINLNF